MPSTSTSSSPLFSLYGREATQGRRTCAPSSSATPGHASHARHSSRQTRDSAEGDLLFFCADLAWVFVPILLGKLPVNTSSTRETPPRPVARAQDHPPSTSPTASSPTLSPKSTAHDGDDDPLELAIVIPSLPAPSLPRRVAEILRTPPPGAAQGFGTASWGSSYPESDHNLRRLSFGSDTSDDSPIHHLSIDTPFLRSQPETEPVPTVISAATVLANRARRPVTGLTEDWIRTHTTGIVNAEPKHWFSEGSETDHSSLSGSEVGCLDESDLRTPRAAGLDRPSSTPPSRRRRGRSSVETLKPRVPLARQAGNTVAMTASQGSAGAPATASDPLLDATHQAATQVDQSQDEGTSSDAAGDARMQLKPAEAVQKPLLKNPLLTPRIKKKVPWRGKNIMVLVPRDDHRGLPGKCPLPLRADEVERMSASWKQLGYSIDGFDLLVEGYRPPGTHDSQSRQGWPSDTDMVQERAEKRFKVTLPDLNAWKSYVNELQEAKLRALGVSLADKGPEPPRLSPPTTNPSRQPSAQHASLPFSPPMLASSASTSHGIAGYPFPGQFIPPAQSPGLPSGPSPVPFAAVPAKFNSRQSISLLAGPSPFQLRQPSPQGWHKSQPSIMQGLVRNDSPSLANLNRVLSPQSPYGMDGLQQAGSPAFNMHQRHQSMQYLPQHMKARASPHLHEVIEEEDNASKSPSPELTRHNPDSLQAEIDDAEYHLEEQLREQFEHENYNPQAQAEVPPVDPDRSGRDTLAIAQGFANEPGKPLVLHHPRPHSRGHSLSQNFFRDPIEPHKRAEEGQQLDALSEMPEAQKSDEAQEIQTNPSELGTPSNNFDFHAALSKHVTTLSNASNPWRDHVSAAGSTRRSSHGSRPSLSTLNVEAPEFKFNPGNTFTPGLFNFSGTSAQPAVFQAGNPAETPSAGSVSQFSGSAKFHATAPSFSPGQSEFSFSGFGPMFRPDAPAFTPFHPPSGSVTSPGGSSTDNAGRGNSIFGNIDIRAGDIVKPAKKSKAIPIVRPSSRSSVKPKKAPKPAYASDQVVEDRPVDESRVKRARSAAPDGDDVPLFAKRPEDATEAAVPGVARDEQSGAEDGSILEGDNALVADTSMSSVVTSDHVDTKATTAASSEISPTDDKNLKEWAPFEFGIKVTMQGSGESRVSGDDRSIKAERAKTSSDTAGPLQMADQGMQDSASSHVKAVQPAASVSAHSEHGSSQASRPKLTPKGLGASRFASPPRAEAALPASMPDPRVAKQSIMPSVEQDGTSAVDGTVERISDPSSYRESTFEEIDAVMQHMESDPSMGVNKSSEAPKWQPPTSIMEANSPGADLQPPVGRLGRDGASLTPRPFHAGPEPLPLSSTELDDPFVDPPASSPNPGANEMDDVEPGSELVSDWEGAFSEDEHSKLESRAQFFDGRVHEVMGGLLASRLEPVEKALFSIQHALALKSRRTPSSRREMRSISLEFQESDADDEDEELVPRRSMSPRRDRKMELIRNAVTEAFTAQQRHHPLVSAGAESLATGGDATVLKALAEIKEHLAATTAARAVETDDKAKDTTDGQETTAAGTDEQILLKMQKLQAKLVQFEDWLNQEQFNVEKALTERRAAQDEAAELNRKLQAAETRVEVEIINRSVFDQRVADLEERLRQQEDKTEEETKTRRAAEDRISEVQRLLRISEETRLREVLEEKDERIKTFEQESCKTTTQMALLEVAQTNATQAQSEMTNKINALETDLREVRQDNTHWRSEAERADESAGRKAGELAHFVQENKLMEKSLASLTAQLEENERLRESWRAKFMSLQEEISRAARDIAKENARRISKDQAMIARQEVLDARLQAEAKTRERLEIEMERLQLNERSGMRAVNECKRLEGLLAELQTQKYKLQQSASRHQREFEEARESGASEVRRTRMAMQTEIDAANNQVNVIREELEEQNSKLRSELDNVKLDADTSRVQNEMLLEEAQTLKTAEMDDVRRKHQNELEDMQTRFERQIGNANEDAQKAEQLLLERLSLSSSKIEHLQDRIVHLEDKLEIAKEAAAAAHAAKSAATDPVIAAPASAVPPQAASGELGVPEKISPQALRESIMVLQEQLQAREQRIEELEQIVAKADPDAATKISRRDDEISWLRELLAVRHGDLQDIIAALSGASYDGEAVKDAAIRLKANLQMEEQERKRAINGGSAIHLPNIAQSIQAATPRAAQTIGPIAAAWGNWRKSNQQSLRSISSVLNAPAGDNATPSKSRGLRGSQSNTLGGLLTPPTSGLRQPNLVDARPQPTAFSSTGRRYTAQSSVPSRARGESNASRRSETVATAQETPPRQQERRELMTPPMMHDTGYDSDTQPGDFNDQDFFEDDED